MTTRRHSPRRRIITYALLVAMSLVLLAISNVGQVQELRRGVNYALSPVQDVLASGARSVSSMFSAFGEIDQLRMDKRNLEAQVAALEQQIAQIDVLRRENDRLTQLLGTRSTTRFKTQAADVVQGPPSEAERVVTIDRGREVGISEGDAVLAPGGALAGVITSVGNGYATVRLISDTRSLIIGQDKATGANGELVGNLSQPLLLGNIPATERLGVGDTIVTAGQLVDRVRSLLPRDLLIGTIVDAPPAGNSVVRTALVQPTADLDHLQSVMVITSYDAPNLPNPNATPAADDGSLTPTPAPVPTPKRTKPPRGRTPGP